MTRRILIVHATQNTPGHGNDAGGAFVPEAINFAKYRTSKGDVCQRVGFDNLEPDKRKRAGAFLRIVEAAEPFDAIAYLGHGLRNSLSSAGIGHERRQELAGLIKRKARGGEMIVTLYACSTGETTTGAEDGDGGFADRLRDDLETFGLTGWVDGHTCAAHTTQNPYLRRFEMGDGPNDGGAFLVQPQGVGWAKWRARLNSKWREDPFRFDFPFMPALAVRRAVGAA